METLPRDETPTWAKPRYPVLPPDAPPRRNTPPLPVILPDTPPVSEPELVWLDPAPDFGEGEGSVPGTGGRWIAVAGLLGAIHPADVEWTLEWNPNES